MSSCPNFYPEDMDDVKILESSGHILGCLRPITPHGTSRYDTRQFVERMPLEIPPGLFCSPTESNLPYAVLGWVEHVHPEGSLFFTHENTDGELGMVTSSNLRDSANLSKINRWITRIKSQLAHLGISVMPGTEVFLELEDGGCAYYLVDHANQVVFWLEACDTDSLGLPDVAAREHLKIVLKWLYLAHIEYFPSGSFGLEWLVPLEAIFSHGLCDQMTSSTSTFGYTAEECQVLLGALRVCRGTLESIETTCTIARLWGMVFHHRIWNHYGQEQARLSRDQAIFYREEKNNWTAAVVNALTFGSFGAHLRRLEDVFVDDLVNVAHWRKFVHENVGQWKREAMTALLWLLLSVPSFFLPPSSISLLATSALLLSSSLTTALSLYNQLKSLEGLTADQARDYLSSIEFGSTSLRFAPSAFVFSLPQTLCICGAATTIASYLLVISARFGAETALLLFAVLLGYSLAVYLVVTGRATRLQLPRLFPRGGEQLESIIEKLV
ncbi:hypothetical protein HMN09_00385800 [Mycena chlorophos]|uniref:Uncharacterized protein n=1 Tax=Mycena chlorophos TaxID=658473 RepID=A0A8H6TJL3_MYCCL|nr:hypothetical protein HMN09_00385800 [Mycena chlorophos]